MAAYIRSILARHNRRLVDNISERLRAAPNSEVLYSLVSLFSKKLANVITTKLHHTKSSSLLPMAQIKVEKPLPKIYFAPLLKQFQAHKFTSAYAHFDELFSKNSEQPKQFLRNALRQTPMLDNTEWNTSDAEEKSKENMKETQLELLPQLRLESKNKYLCAHFDKLHRINTRTIDAERCCQDMLLEEAPVHILTTKICFESLSCDSEAADEVKALKPLGQRFCNDLLQKDCQSCDKKANINSCSWFDEILDKNSNKSKSSTWYQPARFRVPAQTKCLASAPLGNQSVEKSEAITATEMPVNVEKQTIEYVIIKTAKHTNAATRLSYTFYRDLEKPYRRFQQTWLEMPAKLAALKQSSSMSSKNSETCLKRSNKQSKAENSGTWWNDISNKVSNKICELIASTTKAAILPKIALTTVKEEPKQRFKLTSKQLQRLEAKKRMRLDELIYKDFEKPNRRYQETWFGIPVPKAAMLQLTSTKSIFSKRFGSTLNNNSNPRWDDLSVKVANKKRRFQEKYTGACLPAVVPDTEPVTAKVMPNNSGAATFKKLQRSHPTERCKIKDNNFKDLGKPNRRFQETWRKIPVSEIEVSPKPQLMPFTNIPKNPSISMFKKWQASDEKQRNRFYEVIRKDAEQPKSNFSETCYKVDAQDAQNAPKRSYDSSNALPTPRFVQTSQPLQSIYNSYKNDYVDVEESKQKDKLEKSWAEMQLEKLSALPKHLPKRKNMPTRRNENILSIWRNSKEMHVGRLDDNLRQLASEPKYRYQQTWLEYPSLCDDEM